MVSEVSFMPELAKNMVMASAAAVPSSSKDALAMCIEVKDMTMVWKLTSDSRRPGINGQT